MSKTISVWGSPGCGKTTFSVKLASTIYERYHCSVLVLLTDNRTPSLPVLFPARKAEELYSIGVPLSKAEITQDEIIKNIVTVKGKMNFGFLGYKDGENQFAYPSADENKCVELLETAKTIADFIVTDCQDQMDALSRAALRQADTILRLASPDLKSLAFFASQLPLYADPSFKAEQHIIGLNINQSDAYLPAEDAKTHLGGVSFTLPYCREIRMQELDGALTEKIKDKKYNRKIRAIADHVVSA